METYLEESYPVQPTMIKREPEEGSTTDHHHHGDSSSSYLRDDWEKDSSSPPPLPQEMMVATPLLSTIDLDLDPDMYMLPGLVGPPLPESQYAHGAVQDPELDTWSLSHQTPPPLLENPLDPGTGSTSDSFLRDDDSGVATSSSAAASDSTKISATAALPSPLGLMTPHTTSYGHETPFPSASYPLPKNTEITVKQEKGGKVAKKRVRSASSTKRNTNKGSTAVSKKIISSSSSSTTSSTSSSTSSAAVTAPIVAPPVKKGRSRSYRTKKKLSEEQKNMTKEELLAWKKQERLEKNRASAQLSRERRKKYMEELEKKVRELTERNHALENQVAGLIQENRSLRHRLEGDGDLEPLSPISSSADSASTMGSSPLLHRLLDGESSDTSSISSSGDHATRRPPGYHHHHHEPPHKRTKKKTMKKSMVFFAFVMTFGFLFSLMGLHPPTWPAPSQGLDHQRAGYNQHPPLRRVLLDVPAETPDKQNFPSQEKTQVREERPVMKYQVSADSLQKKAVAPLEVSEWKHKKHDSYLQVEDEEDLLESTQIDFARALDLYRGVDKDETNNLIDFDTVYEAYATAVTTKLEKLLQHANLSSVTGSGQESYLLCPHASLLQNTGGDETSNDKTATSTSLSIADKAYNSSVPWSKSSASKRLNRAIPTDRQHAPRGSPTLFLWVPTSSLESSLLSLNRSLYEEMEKDPEGLSGLSQITCQVSDVHPVTAID